MYSTCSLVQSKELKSLFPYMWNVYSHGLSNLGISETSALPTVFVLSLDYALGVPWVTFLKYQFFPQRCKLLIPVWGRVETWGFSRTPLVILNVRSLGSRSLNLPDKWKKRSLTGESRHNCPLLQLYLSYFKWDLHNNEIHIYNHLNNVTLNWPWTAVETILHAGIYWRL